MSDWEGEDSITSNVKSTTDQHCSESIENSREPKSSYSSYDKKPSVSQLFTKVKQEERANETKMNEINSEQNVGGDKRRNSTSKSIDMNNNRTCSTKDELNFLSKLIKDRVIGNSQQIELLRADPNSPLYSVKSFNQLRIPEPLLKGIYSMGFQKPSKIQESILPLLMGVPYQNCIAQSQSGTGKTAAYLISSLKRVDVQEKYPQVLILCPTLELAMQVASVATEMSKFTEIKVRNITKGELRPSSDLTEHVLVGTPGKVLDWGFRFKAFDPSKIKVFVLDEADMMIDVQGHRQQSIKIQGGLSKDCQLMLFSATFDQDVLEFAECIIENPLKFTLSRSEEVLSNVTQFYSDCKDDNGKYTALADIFGNVLIGQTIIFVHTKKSAVFLKEKLERDGHKIALLTGELTTEERLNVIKRFREGDERLLITTNVASRGLDIDQVTLVVNYDLPYDVHKKDVDFEAYLHRIGRAGRFLKPGFAVSLIDASKPYQKEQIEKISEHFMTPIKKFDPSVAEEFNEWE